MADNKKIEKTVRRFTFVYITAVLISILVIIRIISLQFFSKDKVTTADIYNTQKLEARRGSILANDGRPLAISMPYYQIRMDCVTASDSIFNSEIDALSKSLSNLFKDKSASAYKTDIIKARKSKNQYKLIGNRSIDFSELKTLKEFPIFKYGKFKGGLIVTQKNKRVNPYGSLAYRTIGYINEDGGGVGLENSFNYKLEGTPGLQYVKRELGGNYIPVIEMDAIEAIDGYDLKTTIDIDIQEAAEMALKEQLSKDDVFEGGTAIVMEVSTGAIRAIANMKKKASGGYDESYNYAIHEATEPGSTLKLASLISLLEDGYVTLSTPVDGGNGEWKYKGTLFSDTHAGGYGKMDVKEAFAKSSNVCFAKMTAEYYGKDEATYVSRITNMKIGEKYNLEIEGEGRATIHTTSDKDWSGVTLPMMGIGYGMLLTPLHTLTFYNAVANNGKMMKPYFVEGFEKDGVMEEEFAPQIITGAICSQKTIREAKEALRGVVENGTAARYNDDRYQFSGKTGTAQIAFDGKYKDSQGYRKHQASFAGFFPSDNPKYSCIVVMYTGKTRANFYGGTWATPVFKQITDKIFTSNPQWQKPMYAKGIVPPDNPNIAPGKALEEKITIKELPMKEKPEVPSNGWVKIVKTESGLECSNLKIEKEYIPDVTNMGLKDALYILENEGYNVIFKGNGRVKNQSPAPGTKLSKNSTVTLTLSK